MDLENRKPLEQEGIEIQPAVIDGEAIEASEPIGRTSLLDSLRQLPSDAFERLAQRLLREAGFIKVEVTGKSGDGGIDGIGVLRVKLLSFQVLFQCSATREASARRPSATSEVLWWDAATRGS